MASVPMRGGGSEGTRLTEGGGEEGGARERGAPRGESGGGDRGGLGPRPLACAVAVVVEAAARGVLAPERTRCMGGGLLAGGTGD